MLTHGFETQSFRKQDLANLMLTYFYIQISDPAEIAITHRVAWLLAVASPRDMGRCARVCSLTSLEKQLPDASPFTLESVISRVQLQFSSDVALGHQDSNT